MVHPPTPLCITNTNTGTFSSFVVEILHHLRARAANWRISTFKERHAEVKEEHKEERRAKEHGEEEVVVER